MQNEIINVAIEINVFSLLLSKSIYIIVAITKAKIPHVTIAWSPSLIKARTKLIILPIKTHNNILIIVTPLLFEWLCCCDFFTSKPQLGQKSPSNSVVHFSHFIFIFLLINKKVCETEVTHTQKCITPDCYHTNLLAYHKECTNGECIFAETKNIPL